MKFVLLDGDDNYPKENFTNHAPDNGAFLVRNSWGSEWCTDGYFYISYYDTCLAHFGEYEIDNATGFVFTSVQNRINYDINYNYNPLGTTYWWNFGSKYLKYRNHWTASSNEVLKAVGVYVNNVSTCNVAIYVNDNLVREQNNILLNYAGFHTVNLINPVKLTKNQKFRIEISLKSNNIIKFPVEVSRPIKNGGGYVYTKASSHVGESELFNNGKWEDISSFGLPNANFCLNAYTDYDSPIPTKIEASDITMNYGENKNIHATLSDIKDNKLINCGITLSINGGTGVVISTNNNGQISIPTCGVAGTYKIILNFAGTGKYSYTSKTITLTIKQASCQVTPTSNPTVNLPTLNMPSSTVLTKPTLVTILKVSGISDGKTYSRNAKLDLSLNKKVDLRVTLKVTGEKDKDIKFIKGKCTLKLGNYNFKKDKKYKIKFKSTKSNYDFKQTITIKTK